jgi:hypothetical protein
VSYAEDNANRDTDSTGSIAIPAKSYVFHLRPQRKSSDFVETNVSSAARTECETICGAGKARLRR